MNIIVYINIQRQFMKTVTMRVDDSVYEMMKLAEEGQRRNYCLSTK